MPLSRSLIARHAADALPAGHRLESFRLTRVLGAGLAGFTYLAEEGALGRQMAIKEYFPAGTAARRNGVAGPASPDGPARVEFEAGLARFRAEAGALISVRHRNLVRYERIIEANGTAYLANPYLGDESLAASLARRGTLTEAELSDLLDPLCEALAVVHEAGLLHRDIKPANVLLRIGGAPILVDIGVARQVGFQPAGSVSEQAYAAAEQYEAGSPLGPWTDIYGLGAVLYRCVTGFHPPSAIVRRGAIGLDRDDPLRPAAVAAARRFPAPWLDAIDACLGLDPALRPQSIAALRDALRAEPVAAGMPEPAAAKPERDAGRDFKPLTSILAIPPPPRAVAAFKIYSAPIQGPAPARISARKAAFWGAVLSVPLLAGAGVLFPYLNDRAPTSDANKESAGREAEVEAARRAEEAHRAAMEAEAAERAEQERRRVETEAARQAEADAIRLAAELRAAIAAALGAEQMRQRAEAAERAEQERRQAEADAIRLAAELRAAIAAALEAEQMRQRAEAAERAEQERRQAEADALKLAAELRAAIDAAFANEQARQRAEAARRLDEERRAAEAAARAAEAATRAEAARRQAELAAARRAEEERRRSEAVAGLFRRIGEAIGRRDWALTNSLLSEVDALMPGDARVEDLRGKIVAVAAQLIARADEARERGEWPDAERLIAEAATVMPGARMIEAARARYDNALKAWRDDRLRLVAAARRAMEQARAAIEAGDHAGARDRIADAEEALRGFAADLPEQAALRDLKERWEKAREDVDYQRLRAADETRYLAMRDKAEALYAEAQRTALRRGGAAKACELFRDSGEYGHVGAQNQFALCLATGRGTERDEGEAYAWFRRAAEGGNAVAQFNLANAYLQGHGVERDLERGYQWARKSAEQGYPKAFCRLGVLLRDGRGVEKQQADATALFKRGADAGEGWCMALLAEAYEHGLGVDRSRALARQFYDRAVRAGHEAAREKLRNLR